MVAVVAAADENEAIRLLTEYGETVCRIGRIRERQGDEPQSQILNVGQVWK